jgi:hypothetical protein
MTFLEAIILTLTRQTSSGGTCQVGEASITVRYSLDQLEWEYGGSTFWYVQDLAEAILQGGQAFPTKPSNPPGKARTMRGPLEEASSRGTFFLKPPARPSGRAL